MHTVLLHFLLFQIKDKDKYHFKPHELVVGIMKIYVNLGKEAEFCKAIPRDGRSFSPDLLSRASNKVISLIVYHSQLGQSDEMWVVLQEVRGKVELYSRQLE